MLLLLLLLLRRLRNPDMRDAGGATSGAADSWGIIGRTAYRHAGSWRVRAVHPDRRRRASAGAVHARAPRRLWLRLGRGVPVSDGRTGRSRFVLHVPAGGRRPAGRGPRGPRGRSRGGRGLTLDQTKHPTGYCRVSTAAMSPPRMSFRHAYQESWAAAVPGGLGALRARSGSCARWTPCARTGRSAPARRGPPPDPLARAVHSAPLVAAASPKHRSEKKANKAGSKKGAQKWDRASRRWARGKRTGPSKSVLPRLRMYGGAGTSSADRFRAALSRNAPTGGGGGRLASTGSSLVGETEERLRRATPPGARAGGLAR